MVEQRKRREIQVKQQLENWKKEENEKQKLKTKEIVELKKTKKQQFVFFKEIPL